VLNAASRSFTESHKLLPNIHESETYSSDSEIQRICETIEDQKQIPDTPESMKNAFAVTLFCMEAAFDCRSKDFLKYAFD